MIEVDYKDENQIERDSPLFTKLLDAHKRLVKKDPTIWGPAATAEASVRMDWVDLPNQSRELLASLDALSAKNRHLTKIVLCGMGGSSLGTEVIAKTFGKEITILDSTDPEFIAHSLPKDLTRTLVVLSSKSGSTIETVSQKALFEKIFQDVGLDKTEHIIIVTDPGSPLEATSRNSGFTVISANPHIGGRFSVLGDFGLVPAALLGIDVSIILDSAIEAKESLLSNPHPALVAAYALIAGTQQYFSISDKHASMPGLSDWIEQLIAESTGKDGVGRLPIVVNNLEDLIPDEALSISFAGHSDLVVMGDLGEQFFFWQWVTALIGAGLSVNPFSQPNVDESKLASTSLLNEWGNSMPQIPIAGVDESIVFFNEGSSVSEILSIFINQISEDGYLAITAYLNRHADKDLIALRNILAIKSKKAVTFGWGPRFLHSTGQFHKGGQPNGSFLQITADSKTDFAIPEKEFTFKSLCLAQAIGDQNALANRGLPTLRLHLMNRKLGIAQLLEIAKKL
jgi:glucose-6-phosphate isomerase